MELAQIFTTSDWSTADGYVELHFTWPVESENVSFVVYGDKTVEL